MKKFGISATEVQLALAEIHFTYPGELIDYLNVKYRNQLPSGNLQ